MHKCLSINNHFGNLIMLEEMDYLATRGITYIKQFDKVTYMNKE